MGLTNLNPEELIKLAPFPDEDTPVEGSSHYGGYRDLFQFMETRDQTNHKLGPWWSPTRDRRLKQFVRQSDHLSGAVNSFVQKMTAIPLTIRPKNPAIALHRRIAERMEEDILTKSEYGKGFMETYAKWMSDYLMQDNGAFMAVLGPSDDNGVLNGLPVGLKHLDASKCVRTGNGEFPVLYEHADGNTYKIHDSRVIFSSSFTSTRREMHDVGFCAVSRVFHSVQTLIDIALYKQEKLGSRPLRAFFLLSGMSYQQAMQMIKQAKDTMSKSDMKRFAQVVMLAAMKQLDGKIIDLASLPDGVDEFDTTQLSMAAVALGFGMDVAEFWKQAAQGQSQGDAQIQHQKARSRAPGHIMQKLHQQYLRKLVPPYLIAKYDFTDDQLDESRAKIASQRAIARTTNLQGNVIDLRTARMAAMEAGDITFEQFQTMELNDGRLPEGIEAIWLFQSMDPNIQQYLGVGVADPLAFDKNDPAKMLKNIHRQLMVVAGTILNTSNPNTILNAQRAMAALKALWVKYGGEPLVTTTTALPQSAPNATAPEPAATVETDDAGGQTLQSTNQRIQLVKSASGLVVQKQGDEYLRQLRAIAFALFNGDISVPAFETGMKNLIEDNFFAAWADGAGLAIEDIAASDVQIILSQIKTEKRYVAKLAEHFIQNVGEAETYDKLLERLDPWSNAWERVKNIAKVKTAPETNFRWEIDPTKDNCFDCLSLDGLVKSGDEWFNSGVYPRSRRLECKGFYCGCQYIETSEPSSLTGIPRVAN